MRNRSKELAELLGDVDRIRAERKKAKSNRNKFGGVSGGAMSSGLSSGSRYGGFGSEDAGGYGAYSGGVYGDGGGFGGNTSGFQDNSSRRDRFEEYDEYDEGAVANPGRRKTEATSSARREPKKPEPPKKKEPEIDILAFDDIPPETPPKESASNGRKAISNPMDDGFGTLQSGGAEDDDFDDFQSAAPTTQATSKPSIPGLAPPTATTIPMPTTQFAAPKPVSASQGNTLGDLVGFSMNTTPSASSSISVMSPPASNYAASASTFTSPPPSVFASPPPVIQQQPKPTSYQASTPNYFTSVPVASNPTPQPSSYTGAKSSQGPSLSSNKPAQAKSSSAGGDAFGSLWSTASASAGIKSTSTPGIAGPKLADMAKEKASAGIWGANAPSSSNAQAQTPRPVGQVQGGGQKLGGGLDDLLG